MSELIGRQIELGVGVENVRGTPASTAEKWLKKVSATLIERAERAIDASVHNNLADSDNATITKKWVEGDLDMNLHIDAFGYFLYNLYGSVSSSVVSGSVVDHTFSLENSISHASLAFFAKDGSNSQEVINNAMIKTLEITANVDDHVGVSMGIVGKTVVANGDTPSYDTEYDFIGRDVSVKFADTLIGLGSAQAINAKDLTITFDQGTIVDYILGSYNPDDIYNTKMSIEGEFTMNYIDDTEKDIYMNDTAKYMQITIEGQTDIGSGNFPTVTIVLHKVKFMDWSRDDSSDSLVSQTIGFKAFYNDTESKQSEITLRNLTAEYDSPLTA